MRKGRRNDIEPKCEICGRIFKAVNGLAIHLKMHEITGEEYYLKYVNKNATGKCFVCDKPTTFRGIGVGFLKYCSRECVDTCKEMRAKRVFNTKGKKQTEETIRNRVEKIDYPSVMEKRKGTMLERFGVDNYAKLDTFKDMVSNLHKGTEKPRVSEEHQMNIIESKRRNNTLKHTEQAKENVSKALKRYYSDENNHPVLPKTGSPYKGVKTGYVNNIFYRSSYEKLFIEVCFDKNVNIISAENKEYRVFYNDKNNKKKRYYPDFLIVDENIIVEIKAKWTIKESHPKLVSAIKEFDYFLVFTQDELFSDDFGDVLLDLISEKSKIKSFTEDVINRNM